MKLFEYKHIRPFKSEFNESLARVVNTARKSINEDLKLSDTEVKNHFLYNIVIKIITLFECKNIKLLREFVSKLKFERDMFDSSQELSRKILIANYKLAKGDTIEGLTIDPSIIRAITWVYLSRFLNIKHKEEKISFADFWGIKSFGYLNFKSTPQKNKVTKPKDDTFLKHLNSNKQKLNNYLKEYQRARETERSLEQLSTKIFQNISKEIDEIETLIAEKMNLLSIEKKSDANKTKLKKIDAFIKEKDKSLKTNTNRILTNYVRPILQKDKNNTFLNKEYELSKSEEVLNPAKLLRSAYNRIMFLEESISNQYLMIEHLENGQVVVWPEDTNPEDTNIDEENNIEQKREAPFFTNLGIANVLNVESKINRYKFLELADTNVVNRKETYSREIENIVEEEIETIESSEDFESTKEDTTREVNSEFSKDIDKSKEEEIEANAEVKISAENMMVKIEASAGFGYKNKSSEEISESQKFAENIVRRAEKNYSKKSHSYIRTLRKTKDTDRINRSREASENPSTDGTLWLSQMNEITIKKFGSALTFVFDIPEPGVWLLEQISSQQDTITPPKIHDITIGEVSYNWKIWQERYPEIKLSLPLKKVYNVPFSFNGAYAATKPIEKEEDMIGGHSNFELFTKKIEVPDNHYPDYMSVSFHGWWPGTVNPDWLKDHREAIISINGRQILNRIYYYDRFTRVVSLKPFFYEYDDYSDGLEVSIRVIGALYNSTQINCSISFTRTELAVHNWSVNFVNEIIQAQRNRKAIYERELLYQAELNKTNKNMLVRSSIENKNLIQNELMKWCIQLLIGQRIDINLVDITENEPRVSREDYSQIALPIILNDIFDWNALTYINSNSSFARRSQRKKLASLNFADKDLNNFLKSGLTTVYVPVRHGSEFQVMEFIRLLKDTSLSIENVVSSFRPFEEIDSLESLEHIDLVQKVLRENKKGYFGGPGVIKAEKGNETVTIYYEDESIPDLLWYPNTEDIGRVIEINGFDYTIISFDNLTLTLDRKFEQESSENINYRLKGTNIGVPFEVELPTGRQVAVEDGLEFLHTINTAISS